MEKTIQQYRVTSIKFWTAYWIQMRPYLLFVSGIAGAAGIAMGASTGIEWWKMLLAFVPFFLGYGFGQALTDCFQTDTDKLSAPYRPLSRGIISAKAVGTISLSGLFACAIIFLYLDFASFWLSILAVFGLATYSYIKRRFWWGGPFYNAWIVALLPLMGYFAVSGTTPFPRQILPYLLITFFSYASFVLIGYLKDIEADKATNYKTFPVIWGWQSTLIAGDIFALITISLFWMQLQNNLFAIVTGAAASLIIIFGQIIGHRSVNENEQEALMPIIATVRSFLLFHIAIILHFQASWWWFLLLYYIVFEIFLYRRPSRFQV